ncbi:hypothetical protein H8959_015704 [Pygathrix nigripes]
MTDGHWRQTAWTQISAACLPVTLRTFLNLAVSLSVVDDSTTLMELFCKDLDIISLGQMEAIGGLLNFDRGCSCCVEQTGSREYTWTVMILMQARDDGSLDPGRWQAAHSPHLPHHQQLPPADSRKPSRLRRMGRAGSCFLRSPHSNPLALPLLTRCFSVWSNATQRSRACLTTQPELAPGPVNTPLSEAEGTVAVTQGKAEGRAPPWSLPSVKKAPGESVGSGEEVAGAEERCRGPREALELPQAVCGRNELIARYIKLRTGKTRTRKQVSSHIQVLARRKAREIQAKLKDQAAKDKALQSMAAMSSAQIISATAFHSSMALARGPGRPAVSGFWQGALPGQAGTSHDVKPFSQQTYAVQPPLPLPGFESPAGPASSPSAPPAPPWQGRSVASSKLWMLEFSAFLEQQQDPDTYNKHLFVHIGQSSPSYSDPYLEAVDIRQIYDKFPEKKGGLKELFERGPSNAFFLVKFWADLNTNIEDEGSSFYGVSSQYESPENMIITCSTKVCSFGKQVVEKVETEYARYENGHYSYRIHRSPLCEYMINFIHKLKHLPEKYMMNSVLENFTILQVVTNRDTQETLLCIAYVFEVSASEHGAQHHIYRLVKE